MEFLLLILAVFAIAWFFTRKKRKGFIRRNPTIYPYALNKSLLTNREKDFFQTLRPIAEQYGFYVVIKPRVADFVHVTLKQYHKGSGFQTHFNKIKAKHVDFLLCDPSSLRPVAAFELDDSTHNKSSRKQRDSFVDHVYDVVGLKVFHVYTYTMESVNRLINSIYVDMSPKTDLGDVTNNAEA
ncbi:MAG: DUF2726 domain-containing protein [Defluviitaleaceae bacterium]|nr:DUF2726 domain-containing protein [Defluviitaleaceae bacterium]